MKDTYRHKGLRRQLVETIRNKGIKNVKVLEAIGKLPRHFFLEKAFEEWAYKDKAFPIGNQQTISQPYTVAYQTSLLQIEKREKVLEVGTGSGYQAAILSMLGARVYTIERQEALYLRTRKLLNELGFPGIRMYFRDGFKGLAEYQPFDKILVTAGAAEMPEALKGQLKIGGIMVIPLGAGDTQKMLYIKRISVTEFQEQSLDTFSFVPLLKGLNKD